MQPFDYFRDYLVHSAKWRMKREKLEQLKADEAAKAGHFPELPTSQNDPLLNLVKEEYRPLYQRYTTEVSRADIAISLEQVALLAYLIRYKNFVRVLDTGSGFSSLVLRLEAMRKTGVQCVSVEDNEMWLDKTREFLRANGAPDENLMLWDKFAASRTYTNFDLIYHDMGGMTTRLFSLPEVTTRLAPEGLLILDDTHFECYAPHVEHSLLAGWTVSTLVQLSMDSEGRYASVARRNLDRVQPKLAFHGKYVCADNQSKYICK
jgi:predicted O-methyltransferase YrrM